MKVEKEKRSSVMKSVPKTLDKEKRTLDAVISTNQVDRDGEIIEPNAFKDRIDTFMENPVFLWQHNPSAPIGRVEDVDFQKDKINARLKFRDEGKSVVSDDVWSLYEDGTLRTFSIGFRVFKMEFEDDEQGNEKPPRITDGELYEVSAVSIPANPGAVAKLCKYVDVSNSATNIPFGSREMSDLAVLEKALGCSQSLIERHLIGDAVPAEEWHVVQKLQAALLSLKRHQNRGDDGSARVLADATNRIQHLLKSMN